MCSQLGDLFGWILRGVCVTVNHTSNASIFGPDPTKKQEKKKHNTTVSLNE